MSTLLCWEKCGIAVCLLFLRPALFAITRECNEKSPLHVFQSEDEKGGILSGHDLRADSCTGALSLSSFLTLSATGSALLLRNDVPICQHATQHCTRTAKIHKAYVYQNVCHGGFSNFTFSLHSRGDGLVCRQQMDFSNRLSSAKTPVWGHIVCIIHDGT